MQKTTNFRFPKMDASGPKERSTIETEEIHVTQITDHWNVGDAKITRIIDDGVRRLSAGVHV